MIPCFVLEPTDRMRRSLRRYKSNADYTVNECPAHGYHDAMVPFDEVPARLNERGCYSVDDNSAVPHDDPRWPQQCRCGYTFAAKDQWQVFEDLFYRRVDTGELMVLRDAPAGALWRALWMENLGGSPMWVGADGQAWMCKTPGGDWHIDGPASNCTDTESQTRGEHKCWVRHGVAPNFHVDKNGTTCAAGAGSILCGGWHGFLHNGRLVVSPETRR